MPIAHHRSSENKLAEPSVNGFQNSRGPFVVAAETSRMPMIFTSAKDPDHPIIFVNDSFLSLTGYVRDEVIDQGFSFITEKNANPELLAEIEAAFDGSSENDPVIPCRCSDGHMFWASLFISPVRDKSGEIAQYFASFIDISKIRQENDHRRFLLDELNHRTQNLLATVLGIAAQTLRGKADPEVVKTFEGRILALSTAQSLLGRTDWENVGMRDVINQILDPFGLNGSRANQFSVTGENIRLRPQSALKFAMVFHELAMNALTHGALSTDAAGLIEIMWLIEPSPQGDRIRLGWQESGGPPVTPPIRKGFGCRLIEQGLADELDAKVSLDFKQSGVTCQIVVAVSEVLNDSR